MPARSALVYGDVNLNLIDGSAIWVQSMVLALSRAGCEVTLVVKAPVQTEASRDTCRDMRCSQRISAA